MPTTAKIIDGTSFAELLANQPIVFFGDGAAKCRALIGQHANAKFMETLIQPSARTVGTLAMQAYEKGQFENVASFEPFYLKDFMGTKPKPAIV